MFSTRKYVISRPVYGYVPTLIAVVFSGPSTTHLHTIYADKFLLIGVNYPVCYRCNIYARSLRPHTQCTDQYIHAISEEYFAFKYALNFENMMGCRYSCWYFIYNTLKMLQYFFSTRL